MENTFQRIYSILHTQHLNCEITGFPSFELSKLDLPSNLDFDLAQNLRLGHLIERIVMKMINSSSNYQLLYESVQLIKDKKTLGELDYILKQKSNDEIIHLELAYKFYLFDPSISSIILNNWIGPNRNDSLNQKIDKLKNKQFPLLYNPFTATILKSIDINQVTQALCFLVSLYIPYNYKSNFNPDFQKAIKGYYLNLETFKKLHESSKTYCIPPKSEWGMNPSENKSWSELNDIMVHLNNHMLKKRAPLCWQKCGESYVEFFVVWW